MGQLSDQLSACYGLVQPLQMASAWATVLAYVAGVGALCYWIYRPSQRSRQSPYLRAMATSSVIATLSGTLIYVISLHPCGADVMCIGIMALAYASVVGIWVFAFSEISHRETLSSNPCSIRDSANPLTSPSDNDLKACDERDVQLQAERARPTPSVKP